MKTINKYIIEKLKINRNIKISTPSEKVKLPVVDYENMEVDMNKTWKTLELPTTAYVIYRDHYRGNRPHFADTADMIGQILLFQDDYEDFDINKDILFASDDLHEILKWYFNFMGITDLPNEENVDEWADANNKQNYKQCDNIYALGDIYTGLDSFYDKMEPIQDFDDIIKQCISDYAL